jgi:DNA repair protein RadA/Sms
LREAAKHGFKRAIVPKANAPREPMGDLEIVPVLRLVDALHSI